jgi:hydrogenase expression/formation protein HypD
VTPIEMLDAAQELTLRGDVLLASFGDMLRVPGSSRSLLEVRAAGGLVGAVYSPLDAVEAARRNPERQVVFLAVGFETTAPSTALAVLQAARLGLANFSLLVAHVRVLPAMAAVLASPGNRVQGFLAAGHVCTVMGFAEYEPFVARTGVPVVVTGFEPVDLLDGIRACLAQLEAGRCWVENRYGRSVSHSGAVSAQRLIHEVYEPCDRAWRGMGMVREGGLRLRPEWRAFDAEHRFGLNLGEAAPAGPPSECRAGEVLAGRLRPLDCPHFGTNCTPDHPLGAPMVSAEGACAAYFRYRPAAECRACQVSGEEP